jgi:hypothetical protein
LSQDEDQPRVSGSVQRAQFGGTPTAAYGGVREGEAENWAWDKAMKAWDFLSKPVPEFFGSDYGSDPKLGKAYLEIQDLTPTYEYPPDGNRDMNGYERYREFKNREITANKLNNMQDEAAKAAGAGVVYAMEKADWAWSHGVSRPLATYNLLAGEFLDQDDEKKLSVRDAWNRTATVSFGMAATDQMVETVGALTRMFGFENPVEDWDVDLWDEKSINEAYQKNSMYSVVTGTQDLLLNFAPIPAGKGAGAVARKMNLSRHNVKVDYTADYDRINDGLKARGVDWDKPYAGRVDLEAADEVDVPQAADEFSTAPEADTVTRVEVDPKKASLYGQNALADEIIELTETDDIARIMESPIIDQMEGLDPVKVANLIANTNDYKTVARIHLATKGDKISAAKLFDSSPAVAARLAGIDDIIGKMEPGEYHEITPKERDAWIDSMTDWEKDLYNTLITDGGFVGQGTATMRTGLAGTNPLARATQSVARTLEKGAGTRADLRAAVKNQDFKRVAETRVGYRTRTDADGFEYQEAIIGSKYGLLTHVFNFNPRIAGFAGRRVTNAFSRVPLNVFSFARTRPTDAMDEFYAMVADSPALAPGRTIRVQRPDGISYVEISSEEWIQNSARALAAAQTRGTTALREEVKRIEKEMVIQIGISKGLTPQETLKFLDGFKQKADEAMAGIQENQGYMDTATQKMIQFDSQTIAMLADSEILVPLDAFSRHLDTMVDGKIERLGKGAAGLGREAFDLGQMFFRTNMLLKPGYVLRNAVFEPGITALIAHMSSAPLLLGRDAIRGVFNIMVNTGQRFDEVLRYLPPSGKRKLDAAHKRLNAALFEKDNQIAALIDLNDRAPSVRRGTKRYEAHVARAKEMAMIALRSVADIDDELAAEFFEAGDFEFSARIATGAAKTLDGSDDAIDAVTREITEMEELGLLDGEISALDQAVLDRLYVEQEILLAVRDTRQNLRTIRQRKAERSGRQMTADEAGNQVLYTEFGETTADTVLAQKVQQLLELYQKNGVKIVASEEYDGILALLRGAVEGLEEATVAVRGTRAKYVGKKARLERKKQRRLRSGERVRTIRVGGKDGQEIEYYEPFSGTKGEAYRVDSSGRVTAQQNFAPMGGESVVHALARMRVTAEETMPISPMDDAYWDDLHHYATRHFADEPYIAPAFGPKTLDSKGRDARVQAIVDLISPDQGFRQEMGLKNTREIRAHAEEIVEIVDTYFPSQAAKDLVVSGKKFGPGELAEAVLSDPAAVLSPIEGRIIKAMDSKRYRKLKGMAVNALDKMWGAIAVSPESKLGRWPYYVRQHEIAFRRIMDEAFANSPDGKVSIGQQRAAQLAAHREALATLEKTFYTIRRYNRSVFTSRFLQSFPGAWANGLWRYMYYIPKNKPAETLTALLVGKDTLDSLLKGEDGEPADYWDDDARIVFPMTKGVEIAGIKLDNGWQVGKDAYTKIFAEIPPSRSYLVAATVDSVLQYGPQFLRRFGKDDQADNLQTFVDDLGDYYSEQTGDTTLFDEVIRPSLFSEYGPTKEFLLSGPVGKLIGSVTPGWLRSAETLARSGMESYTKDYIRLAKYRMQVVEAERAANEDPRPVDFEKEVAPYATKWFALRFVEQWTNLAFGAVPLPNYPGSIERDAWRRINGDEANEGMDYEDKLFLLDQMFPDTPLEELLPFTKSTSKNVYDVPTTVDAFNYVERHSDTAEAIATDFPEMPTMVGLLALGKDSTWSASSNTIYQAMKGKGPYPGAELNYIEDISMKDYAIELNVARAWEEFESIDSRYQIEIGRADRAGDKEAVKELKDGRRRWLNGYGDDPESMRVKWPAWYSMYGPSADKAENTANAIMKHIIENDKIWNDKKDDPAWQLLAQFLVDRDAVEQLRLETRNTTEGRAYKQQLKDWMYNTYSDQMQQYPMTKDLWDNTFESDYYEEPIDLGGAQ